MGNIIDRVTLDSLINLPGGRMDGIVVEVVEASSDSTIPTKFVGTILGTIKLSTATNNGDGTCTHSADGAGPYLVFGKGMSENL